jgi:hypothetical protein
MIEATISVIPVQGGWAVEPDGVETALFLGGARAEAYALRLGQASWRTGMPALVLVHNRNGELVGSQRFGPKDDEAEPARSQD